MSATTVSTTVSTAPETVSKKQRRVVNTASINASFDELLALVQKQIADVRAEPKSKSGTSGVKLLLSVSSRVKQLQKDTARVLNAPKKRQRTSNSADSGFLKSHRIVPSMCEFAGWPADSLHSRVDITKAIVKYIKENNLADPAHKKNIHPDAKLSSLLGVTASPDAPLNYPGLQKLIGKLLDKSAPVAKTA